MTDKRAAGRPTGRPLPNVAGDHRLNHVSYGHLGRLTYTPARLEDGQPGQLHTTRNIELSPYFGQMMPFEQLCPPARSAPFSYEERPWLVSRSQRLCLLQSHPEALYGNADLASVLSREVRDARAAASSRPASSALAVGKIADLRQETRVLEQPAVALASGEAGHILRICMLQEDRRGWDDEALAVRLGSLNPEEYGHWTGDSTAITTIKFVVDNRKHNPIRWVLVQKATATTLLEPEVRRTAARVAHPGGAGLSEAFRIFANPLLAISTAETGGGCQTGVSFNPGSSSAPPQLAIMNDSGCWSVWDVSGAKTMRPKHLRAIPRMRGSIALGHSPNLAPAAPHGRTFQHRISWMSVSTRFSSAIDRPGSKLSRRSKSPSFIMGRRGPPQRADHIFVCDDTSVRVFDACDTNHQAGLTVARPGKAERVLDIQICPFDHSKAFVLTTTSIFWIGNESAAAGGIRLSVIASSPHEMMPSRASLRFNVSPAASIAGIVACSVLVYSSEDTAASVFVFTESVGDGAAQVCFQPVRMDGLKGTSCVVTTLVPTLREDRKDFSIGAAGRSPLRSTLFLELFALGTDLRLERSFIDAPRNSGREFDRYLGEVFVVPDGFYDNAASLPDQSGGLRPVTGSEAKKTKQGKMTDFTLLKAQLAQAIQQRLFRAAAGVSELRSHLAIVNDTIERNLAEGNSSFHPLHELADWDLGQVDPGALEREATAYLHDLELDNGRATMTERQAYLFSPDESSLFQTIESQAPVPRGASESYRQIRQLTVRHVLADAYMSLLGVSISAGFAEPSAAEDLVSQGATPQPSSPVSGQEPPSSPTVSMHSQSTMGADHAAGTGDPVVARLGKYLPSVAGIQPRKGPRLRLLSHWPEQPGSDPNDYVWQPGESAADGELRRRRERREEARRRRLSRRLSTAPPEDAGEPSSQALPRVPGIFPSQTPGSYSQSPAPGQGPAPVFSSQPVSAPAFSSQAMSQAGLGPLGGRTPQAKKRKPRKSGFR